jgi:hypothetical protein
MLAVWQEGFGMPSEDAMTEFIRHFVGLIWAVMLIYQACKTKDDTIRTILLVLVYIIACVGK